MSSKSAVEGIIGEAIPSEGEDGQSGWPKSVQMPIKSLMDALDIFRGARNSRNRELMSAIQKTVNFNALWGAVDLWFAQGESVDAFSDDSGLIFDSDEDVWAVVGFLDLNWSVSTLVSPRVYGPKTMAVADQALAEIIGDWLKSIDVPFKYNVEPTQASSPDGQEVPQQPVETDQRVA